jgi:GT2 family glycosyltransferase
MAMDIVVVNYHTPGDLQQFMDSLQRYPPSDPWTVTVVDVETPAHHDVSEWAGVELHSIGVEQNIGYGRACNQGAAYGGGEIIAFFNADVVLTDGALDQCAEALQAHDDWAILGPCQVDTSNRLRHAGIFGTLAAPLHRGWNEVNRGQYGDVRPAVSVSGSAYFAKRKIWRELTDCPIYRDIATDAIGAFLPTGHYYEETWASYHAQAHGYGVAYYGPVTIIHKWHRASPVGGWADQQMPVSRAMFRRACEAHGIPHD